MIDFSAGVPECFERAELCFKCRKQTNGACCCVFGPMFFGFSLDSLGYRLVEKRGRWGG